MRLTTIHPDDCCAAEGLALQVAHTSTFQALDLLQDHFGLKSHAKLHMRKATVTLVLA